MSTWQSDLIPNSLAALQMLQKFLSLLIFWGDDKKIWLTHLEKGYLRRKLNDAKSDNKTVRSPLFILFFEKESKKDLSPTAFILKRKNNEEAKSWAIHPISLSIHSLYLMLWKKSFSSLKTLFFPSPSPPFPLGAHGLLPAHSCCNRVKFIAISIISAGEKKKRKKKAILRREKRFHHRRLKTLVRRKSFHRGKEKSKRLRNINVVAQI